MKGGSHLEIVRMLLEKVSTPPKKADGTKGLLRGSWNI